MTKAELDEILRFDAEAGIFYWINSRGSALAGSVAGYVGDKGYIEIGINGKKWYGHILAWLTSTSIFPESPIDHRDTDRSNNRFGNLRLASQLENTYNRSMMSNNKSSIKGVHWHSRSGKWRAVIGVKGKKIYIGMFDCLYRAEIAIREAREIHHKEFARH